MLPAGGTFRVSVSYQLTPSVQDFQMNQAITFLSDGNDTLRELQLEMSPKATHILDWFHLVRQEGA